MTGLKEILISKLKATSIHLFISLWIFLVVLYFILFDWYPEPFFTAQGGWQGIRLMAFVDLVLGPSLTFIVYSQLKQRKTLIFDFSLIALVQISALIWGGHLVYTQRPIALVFWHDAFYTVTGNDYSVQGIDNPDFSQFSAHVPPLIYSRPLKTLIEMEQFRQLTEKKIPVYAHVSLYEKIEDNLSSVFSRGVGIEEVIQKNASMKFQLEKIVHGNLADYNYIALKAKYQNMILILGKNGNLVGEVKAPYF
ncbi:MAG: hypothetical protein BMS9Abin31_0069 [Gammaproteobacteria bacterium]|nr:MAG: hypothetical protein BMS9Abin31_0069 [Gammaproteobacteria bacterium]